MGMNIERFIHKFTIGNEEIQLSIECQKGFWRSESLAGDWGQSGGKHDSLDEYVKYVQMCYTYQYNFHNHGYKYAKANL